MLRLVLMEILIKKKRKKQWTSLRLCPVLASKTRVEQRTLWPLRRRRTSQNICCVKNLSNLTLYCQNTLSPDHMWPPYNFLWCQIISDGKLLNTFIQVLYLSTTLVYFLSNSILIRLHHYNSEENIVIDLLHLNNSFNYCISCFADIDFQFKLYYKQCYYRLSS